MNKKNLLALSVTIGLLSAATIGALVNNSVVSASADEAPAAPKATRRDTASASKPALRLARGPLSRPAPPPSSSATAPLKLISALQSRGTHSLGFSSDGRTLVTVQEGLKLWDVETGHLKSTLKHGDLPTTAAKFSPSAPLLAAILGEHEQGKTEIAFWNSETGKIVNTLQDTAPGGVDWRSFAFSPDGKTLATARGTYQGKYSALKLWNVATGEEVKTLSDSLINSVAFSPNGQMLATGSVDHVRVWDVASGKLVKELDAPGDVNTVSFSPDSKTLVSVNPSRDTFGGTIKLWNVDSGQLLHSVEPDWYKPQSVLFTLDGQTMIVGGGNLPNHDETGKLLDKESSVVNFYAVADGELKSSLKLDGGPVDEMALSPDGKTLATSEYGISGGKTAVKLWQLG